MSRSVFSSAVTSSCAAVTVPMPFTWCRAGGLGDQLIELDVERRRFDNEVLIPPRQRFQRGEHRPVDQVLLQCRTSASKRRDQLIVAVGPKSGADLLGCGHQQTLDLNPRRGARLDRAKTCRVDVAERSTTPSSRLGPGWNC